MNQNQNAQCCNLTAEDRMQDMLAQEKYLMYTYSAFLPEASCPQLRAVLDENFNDCAANQQMVFDKMNQMGWYPVKNAPVPEVDAARQKFSKLKTQMG